MNVVREIQRINERELSENIPESASWHTKYKDSAYVFIGGLDYDLTEGDVITIMSQYGEVVDCNLVRDKEKGKSRGFAFVAYEDQRSTILAVDNMNGAKLLERTLRCDHVLDYRLPKKKKNPGEQVDEKDQGRDEDEEAYLARRKRIWDFEKYKEQQVIAKPKKVRQVSKESKAEERRQSKIMQILEAKKRKWAARKEAQAAMEGGYTARGVQPKKIWGGEDMRPQVNQKHAEVSRSGRMDDILKDSVKKAKKKKKHKKDKKEKKSKKRRRSDSR
mmetsp:Transcript_9878/g.24329  ORF Transcript_9878/g.24329 Transcript_9878/m.24329 type:complete len:275 (-) Transcript_9878:142-966(-)